MRGLIRIAVPAGEFDGALHGHANFGAEGILRIGIEADDQIVVSLLKTGFVFPAQPGIDGEPGIDTDVILKKGSRINDVLEELAGPESSGYGGVAEQQAGNVRSAAGFGGVLPRELVVEVEGYGAAAAIVIDAIVANTPPVGAGLQAVTADKLGDTGDEIPGVGHEVAVVATAARRPIHLVAGVVILKRHDGELRPGDGAGERGTEPQRRQIEALAPGR